MKNSFQKDHTKTPKIFEWINMHQNSEAIKHLDRNPDELNLKGWMDHTPLHKAAECGNLELVNYLIANNVEINAKRSGVFATPLCWAKTIEIAILLLDNGATMNDRELDMATRQDRTEIIDELLKRGAKINTVEPQFLNCDSVNALDIYIKHGIDLALTDDYNSSILHKKAWSNNVEVFRHAINNGAKWHKDSSNRTPYALAIEGGKKEMINYLTTNYPEYTSHLITTLIKPESLPFEEIFFIKEHPIQKNIFFALTESSKIIKYSIQQDEFIVISAISIDLPLIRSFTFSKNNFLIIPTADNAILKINIDTLQLLESKANNIARFDQITRLVNKDIYFASDGWTGYFLDSDFGLLKAHAMEDGVFYPIINNTENIFATYSYDQETYHNIYTLSNNNELEYINTFFFERHNSSEGFSFNNAGNQFAVSYPKKLNLHEVVNNDIKTIWSKDISKFQSEYDKSDVIFINDDLILLAKGKKVILFSSKSGTQEGVFELELQSEIRNIKINNNIDTILIITLLEIKALSLKKLKNKISAQKFSNENYNKSMISDCKSWFKKLWSHF